MLKPVMNHQKFTATANSRIEEFWQDKFKKAAKDRRISTNSFNLPLARIKRLMKVEEEIKMVASEVPILFSLVTEVFIEDLTLRAWLNTDENKRRILQKNDISFATKTSDMYDFLIYIVPRNDGLIGLDKYIERENEDE